jgi:hypothetical protein
MLFIFHFLLFYLEHKDHDHIIPSYYFIQQEDHNNSILNFSRRSNQRVLRYCESLHWSFASRIKGCRLQHFYHRTTRFLFFPIFPTQEGYNSIKRLYQISAEEVTAHSAVILSKVSRSTHCFKKKKKHSRLKYTMQKGGQWFY